MVPTGGTDRGSVELGPFLVHRDLDRCRHPLDCVALDEEAILEVDQPLDEVFGIAGVSAAGS